VPIHHFALALAVVVVLIAVAQQCALAVGFGLSFSFDSQFRYAMYPAIPWTYSMHKNVFGYRTLLEVRSFPPFLSSRD